MLQKPYSCAGCSLAELGTGFVPPEGPADAQVCLIGEIPGGTEVATHRPFTGDAGGMLTRILNMLGWSRESLRISNVASCRAPNDWFDAKAPWYRGAIQHCAVHREPVLNEPHRVFVPMGGTALRTLLNLHGQKNTAVEDFHGTINTDAYGRTIIPTFHPSYLQRGAHNLIGTVMWDLLKAKDVAEHGLAADPGTLIIDPPLDWFTAWVTNVLDAIAQDAVAYPVTVDIETPEKATGKSEAELSTKDDSYTILRVNVSCNPDEGITVPAIGPYMDQLRRLLSGAIMWLWYKGFDLPRLIAAGVLEPSAERRAIDLMNLAHFLQSDLPLGLGFWAPFYSSWGAWKHISTSDPGRYAAIDALQNHRCGFGITGDLQKTGQYAQAIRHQHLLHWAVLKPAQEVGVKLDRQRLTVFKADLGEKLVRLLDKLQEVYPTSLLPCTPPQGLTSAPLANVLHVKATEFTRKGVKRKGKPASEIKLDLYKKAVVIEKLILKEVLVCRACGEQEVGRKHRCKEQFVRKDGTVGVRNSTAAPVVELDVCTVRRWFWQEPYNPDSWPQVLAYIKYRKHRPGRAPKTHKDTTNRETLEKLERTGDPFYRLQLDYRAVMKVKGTYADGMEHRMDGEDRIHSSYTFRPSTMRLSSIDPNLQNVVADKEGDETLAAGFRKCVVSEPGCRLFECDFCVAPESKILHTDLTWTRADQVKPGDELLAFDEKIDKNSKFRPATVIATRQVYRPRVRVVTTHGTITVAAEHPLMSRLKSYDRKWRKAKDLKPGMLLTYMGRAWDVDESRDGGYLAGFFDGEGWLTATKVGFGQNRGPTLDHVKKLMEERQFNFYVSPSSSTAQVEVTHGMREALRFVGMIRPPRLLAKSRRLWEGRRTWGKRTPLVTVVAVLPIDAGPVVAIETTTKTYISDGFFSHNSAIEAVETGVQCRDPNYIRLAKLGVHAAFASYVLGKPYNPAASDADLGAYFKEIKKAHPLVYDRAKRYTYASLYGQTLMGMVLKFPQLFPSLKTAQQYQKLFREFAPKVPAWQKTVRELAAKQHFLGGTSHPYGYKHWFWSVNVFKKLTAQQYFTLRTKWKRDGNEDDELPVIVMNGQYFKVSLGEDGKRCLAFMPQSIAAGDLKEAMLRLFDPESPSYIGDAYYGRTPLRAPIHDSLLMEIPDRQWDRVTEKVFLEMQRPIAAQPLPLEWGLGPYLTIGVAAKAGHSWGEMSEVDVPGLGELGVAADAIWMPDEGDEDDYWGLARVVAA